MRRLARLAGFLALTASAMPAAAAGANTLWFYERQPITEGETVEVASSGWFKMSLKVPHHTRVQTMCTATGVEGLWNSPGNGLGETRAFSLSCERLPCGRVTVSPYLPWTSTLEGTSRPLTDEWAGVSLDLRCGGTDHGVFTGTLQPTIGDFDPQGPGINDDLDNHLRFIGKSKCGLLGPNGERLWFVGSYVLGTRGHGATGELPNAYTVRDELSAPSPVELAEIESDGGDPS